MYDFAVFVLLKCVNVSAYLGVCPRLLTMASAIRQAGVAFCLTGGGTGIGRALTIALAKAGVHVLIVGRREGPLLETQTAAAGLGAHVEIATADVGTPEGRDKIVASAQAVHAKTPLKYLVHNAATLGSPPATDLSGLTLSGWRQTMAVNVEGPLFLTQALLPVLSSTG